MITKHKRAVLWKSVASAIMSAPLHNFLSVINIREIRINPREIICLKTPKLWPNTPNITNNKNDIILLQENLLINNIVEIKINAEIIKNNARRSRFRSLANR